MMCGSESLYASSPFEWELLVGCSCYEMSRSRSRFPQNQCSGELVSMVPELCGCSPHLPFVEKTPKCSALLPECQGRRVRFAAGNVWMIYRKIHAHPNDFQKRFD